MIGDSVNKTARVGAKSDANNVFISEETKDSLSKITSMYFYEPKKVEMKGLPNQNIYAVSKGRQDGKYGRHGASRGGRMGGMYSNRFAKNNSSAINKQKKDFDEVSVVSATPDENFDPDEIAGPDNPSETSRLSDDDKLSDINKSKDENQAETDLNSFMTEDDDQMMYMNDGGHNALDGEFELVEQTKYLFSIKNEETERKFIVNMFVENWGRLLSTFVATMVLNKIIMLYFFSQRYHVSLSNSQLTGISSLLFHNSSRS